MLVASLCSDEWVEPFGGKFQESTVGVFGGHHAGLDDLSHLFNLGETEITLEGTLMGGDEFSGGHVGEHMPGRTFDQLRHGEFGFSRRHDWAEIGAGRFGCLNMGCGRVTDDPDSVPDTCIPHDEPMLQASGNVNHSASKRYAGR